MTFDVEQVKPLTFLKPKYFRFERNPRIFACHPLPQQDIETVINEWKRQDEEKKKKRIPVYRYAFVLYHKHFLEHQRFFQSLRDSRCVDIGEARQWLTVIETYPLDFSRAKAKMKQLHLSINNQQLTIEILEWMQCSERQGYILYMNDSYKENEQARYCKMNALVSVKKRRVNVDLLAARMAKSNSFKCSQLRLFFDQRVTILFDPKDIMNLKERSAREIPQIFKNRIENFVAELSKRFLQDLPKKETRRKMFEITLIQESTKLAFHAIRNYIGFLQRENDIINIDSNLVGKRIFFPLEQLKEYFKEPILHLANIEWVRFSSTDVDHWTDLIGQIIMDQLDQEKITNSPILKQFLFFIQDEKISEGASIVELIVHVQNLNTLKLRLEKAPEKLQHLLFTIRLKKVWQAIQLRLQTVYKRLIQRLTSNIAQQIEELQGFFRKDVRILSFRSINPAQMLSNKATVDDMLDNDIPNHGKLLASIYDQILILTQHILLDSSQDEALIRLSTTCRSLPKLIEHHHQFFIRRLGTFQLFVNKRQKCVHSTSQKLSEKLRILQTMAIPQDSGTYLTEISNLKPSLQELLNDLLELNRFEKVIGSGVTELPRHKQAAEHMNVMEQLFSCTIKYFQVVNDFFESHRTSVNIHTLSDFISHLLKQLSDFERCLVGQRASRLFIGQLRNDVDAFKKNFAVMEIMSCPRLLDNHWSKMSEIMSFDMSAYANSSVSVLCELGLEKHLSQLKPIVFAAEREAHVIDHLDDVIAYWTTALFDIEEIKYWHLKRPTNLRNLLNDAKKDVEILHDIRDTDASPPHISDNLNKWTSTVEKLKEILENWYVTWEDWHKVARLFERSRFELNDQFKQFRECAKYWKKLVENLIGDSSVLRILELKHVQCWLRSISGMMLSITQNLGHLMERIRSNFTRLTIVSDYHLLILLSAENSVEALSQFVQLVFPHLRNIQFTTDGFMELHDHSGDRMVLEQLTYESCKMMSCCDLIEKIEDATFKRIVEVLSDEQHMEYGKHSNKMLKHLSNELFSHKKIPDELCVSFVDDKFVLETSSHVQQSNLILEFVHLNCKQISLPRNLCQFWADGNIILLIGSLSLTRNVLSNIISKLYVSYHFVNCHEDLDVALIQRVVEASAKESVLIIMENLNLLSASGLHNLFSTMRKRVAKQPFPRLFLTSCEQVSTAHMPMCVTPYKITKDILPVEEKLEIQLFNENDNEPSDFDVSVIVPKKVLTPIEILADRLKTRNVSACVGSLAKSFLRKSQEFLKQKLEWFYIDGLTKYQSIRKCTGFGGEYEGVLLDVLTKNGILSYEEGCEELKQIIIFYGYTNIWQMIPILNTLFLRFDDNIIPKSYMTLADGSTILCPLATHCVLCIPDSEDSKQEFLQSFGIPYEVYNSDLMNTLFETYELFWRKKFQNILVSADLLEPLEVILRKVLSEIDSSKQHADVILHLLYQEFCQITPSDADALIMASVILIDNFLTIYADLPQELDALIHKRLTMAVSCAKLPASLSEWKLSSTDLSKLVKWQDQPYYRSSLEKEDRLSDLVVVWPALDRMIYYGLRLLSLGRNLIVSGSSYSQKSTFVKMLGKQLEREPDVSISFHWLGNESRTSLENVQKMFVRVVEDAKINETKYIVVDKFSVAEPLLAVLELFVDCGAYYQNEKRVTTERQLKFILITEDEDWMSLEDNHALWDTFSNLPMKSLTFDELQLLVYQLVNWNLNLKSFSTEYQKVLNPISYGTVFLATRAYVPFAVLSVCMRIVKGLQFAFPDNSPDTPSFVRLWVHECLRVIMDGLDNDQIPMLIEDMKSIIREQFSMTEEDLLKELNCWSTDDDEQLLNEKAIISVISLQTLLYSEMDVTDTYDGLSYVPVKSMVNFNRIMENFLFEYHKNHKRDRIQLSINNEISACVQQISRIIRQTGEHLCLCGLPGQGRSQMVTLAAAANSAQLISLYPDAHSFETFVKGWYDVFTRSILSILTSNQQVCILVHMDFIYARVEPRWMDYLRLWLERPETSRIISDEQLIAYGEQLIENEKSLAAQMQSVGIRLPGQRLCRFLAIEVLKEPQTLRRIMESRIHDLIHVVFLVSHHVKSDFSWCSVVHVKTIDESRYDSVTYKILQDAKIESEVNAVVIHQLYGLGLLLLEKSVQKNSETISDFALLYHIVNQAAQVYERKHLQYSEKYKSLSAALLTLKKVRELKTAAEQLDCNLLSERITDKESQLDNTEKDIMLKTETLERLLKKTEDAEKVIEQKKKLINELQKTLDEDLTEPENNYKKAIESLNRFSANDYRSYSQLPKPSIGSRYVAEVLQIVVGPEFKRKTNKAENWVQLQKMLRTPQFFTRILKFEPASLSMEKLSKTLKYVENREFRPVKMRTECELAAELSIWVQSLVKLSSTLKNLREKRNELGRTLHEVEEIQMKNAEFKIFINSIQDDLTLLNEKRRQLELDLSSDRKLSAYQRHSGLVLNKLGNLEKKWIADMKAFNNLDNDLFGISCLQSIYVNMVANESRTIKQKVLDECLNFLKNRQVIQYANPSCPDLAMEFIRNLEFNRRFALFIDENDVLLKILLKIFAHAATIDVEGLQWLDEDLCQRIVRHLSNSVPLILYNVTEAPPVEYYSFLSKWDEKEILFQNVPHRHPDDVLIILIARKIHDIPAQLARIIDIFTLNEKIYLIDALSDRMSEQILNILKQKSASEILESDDNIQMILDIVNSNEFSQHSTILC